MELLDLFCASESMIGLIGAFFLIGIVIGCSTLTRMGDVVGRKPIYMLGLFMHITFIIIFLNVTNKWIAYALLCFFGMSVTAKYYVGYTYLLEIQPKSHHVLVSTTMFLFESVIYITICLYFTFIEYKDWKLL